MKTVCVVVLCLMLSVSAMAQTVTFSITSSARTSTPNLRITYMNGPLQVAPGSSGPGAAIQAFVVDSIGNYYLTKTKTVNLSSPRAYAYININTDQDTKMYVDADLTNYWIISALSTFGMTPRN